MAVRFSTIRVAIQRFCAGLALLVLAPLVLAPLVLASGAGAVPAAGERPSGAHLSPGDIERYRAIFAVQEGGDWAAADELIAALENESLLGYVLAQRYLHPTHYRSSYDELADWLERYADHPDALRLYKLALARRPAAAAKPRRPVRAKTSLSAALPVDAIYLYRSKKKLTRAERRQVQRLKRRIRGYISRTHLSKTEQLLEQSEVRRLLDRFEIDEATAQVAAGWYYYGKADKAFEMADAVAERSGAEIPVAHWTAGLAAFRLGRFTDAVRHFELLAGAERASGWNRSAGAYWAARVYERAGDPAATQRWLAVAAGFPFTFYGLLAQQRLDIEVDLAFAPIDAGAASVQWLLATPRGQRAAALAAVGRHDLAELELMALPHWKNAVTTRALLAFSQVARLPRLGFEVAQRLLLDPDSGWSAEDLAAVLYPLPQWRAEGGFEVDRALIYAFVRQESGFDPTAKSPDGARGLMQLMPRTASALDRARSYRGETRDLLFEPALNLALGQSYLQRLLTNRRIDGDMLRLTVAYNAGPGNLGKWERRMRHGRDPLLYIESLPSLESRLFVERVMANLWIYRLRLGQPAPSLSALAADRWPAYEAIDRAQQQVAASP